MSATTTTKLITADELLQMHGLGRCELINGEIHHMAPAGEEHGYLANSLSHLLTGFVKREKLGRVYAAETGFLLSRNPDTVRAPDCAFIRADRVLPRRLRGFVSIAPDLAVEVVSPDDRVSEVEDKVQQWLDAGSLMVWVIWPATRVVTVYRPGMGPQTLRESDDLEGGDVVPGFRCRVAQVFED